MRIAFISEGSGYGGAEKVMAFLVKALQCKGHTAFIIHSRRTRTNLARIWQACRNVKKQKPDILIGFLKNGNFCAATCGKILHIPSIVSERADPFTTFSNITLKGRIKLWLINQADGAVFQTVEASRFYSAGLQSRCAVIPNAVYLNTDIPDIGYAQRPHTVVSLCRIANRQKRLDVAINAFEIFHRAHTDYRYLIYGDGDDLEFLKSMVEKKGLSECVEFKGKTDNPLMVLSVEGIFLISSDYEGISNSLLEAMAIGLPVVSTDHSPGGARLLISDHQNGILVPMGNPEAMADAIAEFADDKALAEQCGNNARKVLERFSPGRIVNEWEEYIVSRIGK